MSSKKQKDRDQLKGKLYELIPDNYFQNELIIRRNVFVLKYIHDLIIEN